MLCITDSPPCQEAYGYCQQPQQLALTNHDTDLKFRAKLQANPELQYWVSQPKQAPANTQHFYVPIGSFLGKKRAGQQQAARQTIFFYQTRTNESRKRS
jgi:hypothetical protein